MSAKDNQEKNIFILVAEDSKTQAVEIKYFLESNHYSVHVCFDGQEAFEWLKSSEIKPDIIISDVQMPKMDGYELCRAIRSEADLKDIPVLLLTSLSDPGDIMKSLEAGADKFLVKPFSTGMLPMTIDELYANSKRKDDKHLQGDISLTYGGNDYLITADKARILNLLISSYESAYYHNVQLQETRSELEKLNAQLEQKVQERTRALRVQEERFRTLTEHSPDVIMRYGKNIEVVYSNKETGFFKEIFWPDLSAESKEESLRDSVRYINTVRELFESEGVRQLEFFADIKEGRRWYDSIFVPEYNDAGEIEYVLNISRDMTEHKKIIAELEEKEAIIISQSRQAAMGNMIGIIAHQWRQPLTVISMISNNILLNVELGEEVDKKMLGDSMKKSNEQIKYLNKTIEDFRDFFKPNRVKTQMSITEVMNDSLQLIEKSLINNKIKLTKEYSTAKEILMFPNELMQVFINLINNAKDAIVQNKVEDGQVTVSSVEDGENIIIKVSDNAGGIPDEVSDKIGEMNFTTKEEKGTGLGIYMSKMIVEKHFKGSLTWFNECDDQGKRVGASFIVSIPMDI